MAMAQGTDNNQGIARDRRSGALIPCATHLILIMAALTLAASVMAFAAPQAATQAPAPAPAPQAATPAQPAQPRAMTV